MLPFGIAHTPLGKSLDALLTAIVAQGLGCGGASKFKKTWAMKGDYDKMLTLPLLPVFHTECEYAIPAAQAVPAMKAFRNIVEETISS